MVLLKLLLLFFNRLDALDSALRPLSSATISGLKMSFNLWKAPSSLFEGTWLSSAENGLILELIVVVLDFPSVECSFLSLLLEGALGAKSFSLTNYNILAIIPSIPS